MVRIVTTHFRVRVTAGLVGALALATCSQARPQQQPPITGWTKLGASYDDYLKERSECILASRVAASGTPGQAVSSSIVARCMNARGWVRDDAHGFKPPSGEEVEMVR
jgi:hypothetical protein